MLPINSSIFKAYDIRGLYGQDFDNEAAYLLGLAYVELRQQDQDYRPDKRLRIAVGADMRLSSEGLKTNLIRGLLSKGADVIDLGLISTPTLYFAVAHYAYDGGIIVSASHNPKEWNGFKLVRAKGLPISGETGINFLKDKVLENHFLLAPQPGTLIKNEQALDDEIASTLKAVDLKKIKAFRVIADAANGMGALYLKKLWEKLPGELITLNFNLDGTFPAHEADPLKGENLEQLKKEVLKQKADLGIATDGDGDRVFFVDNLGQSINPAIIRGLLAKKFLALRPGAKIGYDVRPGKITEDLIRENGGQAVLTRVGHSLIKEQMLKEDLFFAGESSGHFFLNQTLGCFEYPSLMILKFLEELSEAPGDPATYLASFNKYFSSGEINRVVADKTAVFAALEKKYFDGKISRLDGLSISYPDFWFNVRASNTEAKIRLNLEAINPELMAQKRDEILGLIK